METFTNSMSRSGDASATIRFSSGLEAPADAPVKYGGKPGCLTPEELFVASVSSCLMMSYYYFAGVKKVAIASYDSTAEGDVEKGSPAGGMWFTAVRVLARVKPVNPDDAERCKALAASAEKYCIVSASVKTPVHYQVEVIA